MTRNSVENAWIRQRRAGRIIQAAAVSIMVMTVVVTVSAVVVVARLGPEGLGAIAGRAAAAFERAAGR